MQSGRRQTRFGSREQAQRNCANAYRNGMEMSAHVVHHHVDGAPYIYPPNGMGRFPKDDKCFWKWSAEQPQNPDTVPVPQWDIDYGDEFKWLSGSYGDGKGPNGPGYVGRNLIAALKWQLRTLGVKQILWDDAKGTSANYIAWATNTLWELGLIDYAAVEYFDGNRGTENNYITSYPISGAVGCLDYSDRFATANWCNNPGKYDLRQLLSNGLLWINPSKALTFTDDADTVLSEPMWRVLQATAKLCTFPGYPLVFGRYAYAIADGGFGLMNEVLNCIWFGSKFRNGPMVIRDAQPEYLIYEYPQAPGGLIALGNRSGNYNNPNDWTPVTVNTAWWPNTWIHDYSGHMNDVRVGGNGELTLWVPPADDSGRAFVLLSQHGQDGAINPPERICHQVFEGADDLDMPAATVDGSTTTHIWADSGRKIDLSRESGDVEYAVVDEHGNTIIRRGNWLGEAKARGWHKIVAYSNTSTPTPCAVNARYWGTLDLKPEEFGDPIEIRALEKQ